MSQHTLSYLADNTRKGFIGKHGDAWWAINGQHKLTSDGKPNHFDGPVPMDAAMDLFGWDAVSEPIYVNTPLGMMPIDDRQAVMRADNGYVMGIFKNGYEIHQFRDVLLKNVSMILDADLGLYLGSVGLLRHGAQGYASIEMPDNITTPEGVTFRPRLLAASSHDGSLSNTYKRVITVVECDNTLSAALAETGQVIKIKHSKYAKLKLNDARSALAIVHTMADDFAAEVAALCSVDVSDKAWQMFLEAHVPTVDEKGAEKTQRSINMATATREKLTQMWNADPRVSPWRGTAFGVLQAVNTYLHHEATVQRMERAERNDARAVDGTAERADREVISTLDKVLATIA